MTSCSTKKVSLTMKTFYFVFKEHYDTVSCHRINEDLEKNHNTFKSTMLEFIWRN